jgi:cytidine deaminase
MNNRPSDELLDQYAPLHIWQMAIKQAERCPHKRFKTGCVIYYGMSGNNTRTYSTGTAHPHGGGRRTYSVHAEMHAVSRLPPDHGGAIALILTLTKTGNFATNSRPCAHCAGLLSRHVWGVIYPELCNDGSWAIRRVGAKELMHCYLQETKMTAEAV